MWVARLRRSGAVQLCLWAGADPHSPARDLRAPDPDENDDGTSEDARWLGFTAVEAACRQGDVQMLERLGPDPSRDDFDELYETASNGYIVELLARFAPRKDLGRIISRQIFWMRDDAWFRPRSVDTLQRLFEAGGRWTTSPADQLNDIRRGLLKMSDFTFVDVIKVLATHDYCAPDILHALGRTPAMRDRMKKVDFFRLPPDDPRYFTQSRPTRSREVLAKFGFESSKPQHGVRREKGERSKAKGGHKRARLPHSVRIGAWRYGGERFGSIVPRCSSECGHRPWRSWPPSGGSRDAGWRRRANGSTSPSHRAATGPRPAVGNAFDVRRSRCWSRGRPRRS